MNKCKKECKCTKSCQSENALTLDEYTKEVINIICDLDSKDDGLSKIPPRIIAEIGWMAFGRLFVKKNVKIVPND